MSDEKSVAEQVQELRDAWNAPPSDNMLARVVGENPPEGDGRATSVPSPVLSESDNEYDDDGEVVLKGKALDEALEERGLSKSGTADEKRERIREYDESEDDEEDDEEN